MKRALPKGREGSEVGEPAPKRAMLSVAKKASDSLHAILSRPIFPIRDQRDENSLFDSYTDEEIKGVCVYSKSEIMELHNSLSQSYAKFHTRGRSAHFSRIDTLVVFCTS